VPRYARRIEPDDEHAGGAARAAPTPLRHNRNFQLLWTGQVLSELGGQVGTLAYPLLILALTRSAVIAGVVGTAREVAAFVARLPAGALADRHDRRTIMIVTDTVRLVVLAALAAAVAAHTISWPVVLIVAVVERVGDTLFSPASTAALPAIVDGSQLEAAWAATEARDYAASLGGPALGGVLFGLGRALPFLGDAVSYAASTLTSFGLRGNFRPERTQRGGLWREGLEGLRTIWHDDVLRAVIVQTPLINFAFTGALFTVVVALRKHGVSPTVVGLTQAGVMVGGLLGALVAPRIQGKLPLSRLVVLVTGGGTACFALAAILVPSPLVGLPIAVPLLLSPTANAGLVAVMLRATPEGLRGRVNNALLLAATGLASLAPLIAGVLVAHVSSHWAMGLFAVVLAISAVFALWSRALREAEAAARRAPAGRQPA
jgi:MFS family permease